MEEATTYFVVTTKEQAESIFGDIFAGNSLADALKEIANSCFPLLSAGEILSAFTNAYAHGVHDGGGFAIVDPEDSAVYPAADIMNRDSAYRVCNEEDAYHACAWAMKEYGVANIPSKIANTSFPLLTVNDVSKVAASILRTVGKHRGKMYLSVGSDDDKPNEMNEFLVKHGIADVPRMPLSDHDRNAVLGICKKITGISQGWRWKPKA